MSGIRRITNPSPTPPKPVVEEVVVATNGEIEDIQRGTLAATSTTRVVTFPRAFARAPDVIQVMSLTGGARAHVVSARSATQFTFTDNFGNNDAVTVEWVAILLKQ